MKTLRLRLGLAIVIAAAAFPVSAAAQRVVPPGNSAVNQYTESYPTAGGDAVAPEKEGGSPAKSLGAQNARRLEALGAEGRAAAALAAATGRKTGNIGDRHAGTGSGPRGNPSTEPGSGEPSGSSGITEAIGQATGASTSGQMGLFLPLALIATVAGSLAYLWRKRRVA